MAVLGELSPSMLYLLLTIFNGVNKLSLRPSETYPGDKDFSQFSKFSNTLSFKRLVLNDESSSNLQKLFEKPVKLEFLGLQELSLYSCFQGQAKNILNELLINNSTLKKLKLHFDNVLSGINDDYQ